MACQSQLEANILRSGMPRPTNHIDISVVLAIMNNNLKSGDTTRRVIPSPIPKLFRGASLILPLSSARIYSVVDDNEKRPFVLSEFLSVLFSLL